MDRPATTGIAGRTRSRLASLAPAFPTSSSAMVRAPPRAHLLGPTRRDVVLESVGKDGARALDGGEERRGGDGGDGWRPPQHVRSAGSRIRSKLRPVIAPPQWQLPCDGNPADAGLPDLGEDVGMETPRGREPHRVGMPPHVAGSIKTKLLSLGVAVEEALDPESSEVEEEPPPLPTSPPSVLSLRGTIAGAAGEGEDETTVPVKRKRFSGIDVLIVSGGSSSSEKPGIAKRTRSHFAPESRAQWQRQPGTLSNPYCVDMDSSEPGSEPNSSSSCSEDESSEDDDSNDLLGSAVGEAAGEAEERPKQGKSKPSKSFKGKKRGRRPLAAGDKDVCRVLLDDILQKDGNPREVPKATKLPLVFSFGDDDPSNSNVEKSEYEKALDVLWSEYDFAMRAIELGSTSDYVLEDEQIKMSEAYPSSFCPQGFHKLIIDEQIGVRCQRCSYVEMEIRYVPPSFETQYVSDKPNKNTRQEMDNRLLRELGNETGHDKFYSPVVQMEGTIWDLVDPVVKANLFPHQREGLEFIWKSMTGDIHVEKVKKLLSSGAVRGGCVITHAPGTGKTRLAIVFLQTFLKLFPGSRPVVLAPRGLLLTWQKEFQKCNVRIPFHILNGMQGPTKRGKVTNRELCLERGGTTVTRKIVERLVRLHYWATRGDGVMGVSYNLFERLASERPNRSTEEEKLRKILLEQPELFIFDEGHNARNQRSQIWQVLQRIRTRCRVILSGTPFQNSLRELENVLCLVRPELSGKVSCRARRTYQSANAAFSMRTSPLRKVEGPSPPTSTTSARCYTRDDIEELRSMIRPFVHLHSGSILENLPGLKDCLIFLNPSNHQKDVLKRFQDCHPKNYLDLEFKASLGSLHPSLLASAKLSKEEESAIGQELLQVLRDEQVMSNPTEGVKTRFLVELVRLCGSLGEKVLVFSQYKGPLPWVKKLLLQAFGWGEERVLQMDGDTPPMERQSCIDTLNTPDSEVQVLLATIGACCEGISLVGASRVVLLDTVWNPSREKQAVSRAYRLGQKRVVFTYHLITAETGELERYRRQVDKDRISKLVFPCEEDRFDLGEGGDPSRWVQEDRVLREMREHEKLKDMFKQVVDKPREAIMSDAFEPLALG